jgi:hypothetical protein
MAGAGNDIVTADDGLADRINCGSGVRDVVGHDQFDTISNNSEIPLGPG